MTEPPQEPKPASSPESLPSLGRVVEFVRNILQLERNIEQLKKDNTALAERFERLQRQFDEQSGKLSVLVDFVTRSLDDKVAARAEDAALRAVRRFIETAGLDQQAGTWRDDQQK